MVGDAHRGDAEGVAPRAHQRLLELEAVEPALAPGGELVARPEARIQGAGRLRLDAHADAERIHAVVVGVEVHALVVAALPPPLRGGGEEMVPERRAAPRLGVAEVSLRVLLVGDHGLGRLGREAQRVGGRGGAGRSGGRRQERQRQGEAAGERRDE